MVLSDTHVYHARAGSGKLVRTAPLVRGQRMRAHRQVRREGQGMVRRVLRLVTLPDKPDRFWVPEREELPGGLVEQRLWIGFSTNMYLTRDAGAALLPGTPAAETLAAGSGVIVVARRGEWVRVHARDRFSWLRSPALTDRPFFPHVSISNGAAGPLRITASPWHVPGFGDERDHGPDRLFAPGRAAALLFPGSGAGAFVELLLPRPRRVRLALVNGYAFSAGTYRLYHRLVSCRVVVDGVGYPVTLRDGVLTAQPLGVFRGRRIRLEVVRTVPGTGRNLLALQRLSLELLP